MLQIIRDKTAGVVVKVLFLFLVLSFAVWGIGDYRFLQRGDTPAIAIGGDPVPAEVLRLEFQRDLDRLRRSVGDIDRDVLKQFGLATQTAERIANQWTLDRAAQRLSLIVSDEVVRQRIQDDPNFRLNGIFDAMSFRRLLQDNGFTEQRYVDLVRGDAARAALVEAVSLGSLAPAALADAVFRHREEKRRGRIVHVPASAVPDPGVPDEAALKSVYDANAERFTDPELRGGVAVRIGFEEVRAAIPIDEAQLRAEFESRKREFSAPERRELEMIRFDDRSAAAAARERLVAGADFLAVAAEVGQSAEQVRAFGRVTASSLPSELSRPVFTLAEGAASEPIETPLGVFVARVTAIEPGSEPDFESLRARLADDYARRMATETAYRIATRVEEGVNEGKPLQEAAAAAGIPVVPVEAVDPAGRDRVGRPVAIFAGAPEALRAFLEAPVGRDSGLIETRAGAYFFLRADTVAPSQRRPLDAVRDDAIALWKDEKRGAAARARAQTIADAIRGGKAIEQVAAEADSRVETTLDLRRDGRADTGAQADAPALAGRLFELKPGETGIAAVADGYHVVQLTEILPADPQAAGPVRERLADGLEQAIAGEIGQQYVRALRDRLKVVVDKEAVDRLYQN
jgi:peptidyl-prolyl cis-trans isomerase D